MESIIQTDLKCFNSDTVRSKPPANYAGDNSNFVSIPTRCDQNRPGAVLYPVPATFQFRHGAIKTKLIFSHSRRVVGFNSDTVRSKRPPINWLPPQHFCFNSDTVRSKLRRLTRWSKSSIRFNSDTVRSKQNNGDPNRYQNISFNSDTVRSKQKCCAAVCCVQDGFNSDTVRSKREGFGR